MSDGDIHFAQTVTAEREQIERGEGRPTKYMLDGKRVPGMTTILSRFKDSGGLIQWAYKQGCDGVPLYESRDKAADVGSLIHDFIQADIHGDPHPAIPTPFEGAVISGYSAWRDWLDHSGLTFIATEIPMVSFRYRCGGTVDAMARTRDGKLALVDWKSGNSIYPEHLVQVAGYGAFWQELRGEPVTGGYHICRFSKEFGDFTHKHFPDLSHALRMFELLREAYDIDSELKARAK